MDRDSLEDAPRDPRAYQTFRQGYTERDFEGDLLLHAIRVYSYVMYSYLQQKHNRYL